MKKMIVSIISVFILLLVTVGCSSESAGSADGKTETEDTFSFRIAGQSPDDHPSTQALYTFAEQVKEKTDGRIQMRIFPANQLGDYTTVYEELVRGTIEMALISTPSNLDSRLELLYMPYIAKGYNDIVDTHGTDSYVFEVMRELNEELGVQFLGFHANGFGGLGTTKEITNLLELGVDKDLLLRVPPMDIFRQPMVDIGFRTVTIPYADLYTALQTGSADGWSGGEASLNYLGFRDVIKYYYQTNDFVNVDSLLMNKELFEKLNDEDRLIIEDLANELMLKSFEIAEGDDEKYRKLMEERGIEVVDLSEEEISKIAEHVRENTWPNLRGRLGDKIIDELLKQ